MNNDLPGGPKVVTHGGSPGTTPSGGRNVGSSPTNSPTSQNNSTLVTVNT